MSKTKTVVKCFHCPPLKILINAICYLILSVDILLSYVSNATYSIITSLHTNRCGAKMITFIRNSFKNPRVVDVVLHSYYIVRHRRIGFIQCEVSTGA